MNQTETNPDTIVSKHRLLHAEAYVCADGSTGICNLVYGVLPKGVEIVGNGTCPHPLDVKLSPARARADALVEMLKAAAPFVDYVANNGNLNAHGLHVEMLALLREIGEAE